MMNQYSFQPEQLSNSSLCSSEPSQYDTELDDFACRIHDGEPFISVCLFPNCRRRKLCWKCADDHEYHSGPQFQAPMNVFKFLQITKEQVQEQSHAIQGLLEQHDIIKRLKDHYLQVVRDIKSSMNQKFEEIEQLIISVFKETCEDLSLSSITDARNITSVDQQNFMKDCYFDVMVDFNNYKDLFETKLNSVQIRKETVDKHMKEIMIKIQSAMGSLESVNRDFEIILQKSEQKDFEEVKNKSLKRNDFNIPSGFQVAGNLIGNENVCKSVIQLNDGNLATASRDRTIKIWCSQTQQCLQVLRDHNNWVQDLINLPGLFFCSCSDDKKIKIFGRNPTTTRRKQSLLSMSLGAERSKSSSISSTVSDFVREDWHCLLTLTGHNSYVMRVLSTTENTLISCSTDGTLKIWGFTQPLQEICTFLLTNPVGVNRDKYYSHNTLTGHDNCVYSLALHKNEWFISGDEGGELIKWNLVTGEQLAKQDNAHVGCVNCINVFSSNGEDFIVTCGDDKTIRMWDQSIQLSLKEIFLARSEIECFVMLQPHLLLCGDETGHLVVVSLETEQVEYESVAHRDRIYRIQYYADQKKICTASADHTAKVWNIL